MRKQEEIDVEGCTFIKRETECSTVEERDRERDREREEEEENETRRRERDNEEGRATVEIRDQQFTERRTGVKK